MHAHTPAEPGSDICRCGQMICPDTHKAVAYNPAGGTLPEYWHIDGSACFIHQTVVEGDTELVEARQIQEKFIEDIFFAVTRGAERTWIADFIEYHGEGHEGRFVDYLLFQVQCEEEAPMEERQDAGGYLSRLLRYVHRFHPEQHPYIQSVSEVLQDEGD